MKQFFNEETSIRVFLNNNLWIRPCTESLLYWDLVVCWIVFLVVCIPVSGFAHKYKCPQDEPAGLPVWDVVWRGKVQL